MKVGDIVYFKSVYIAKYISGKYYFEPGDRYRINSIDNGSAYFGLKVRTGGITNLEDGTNHFAHSEHWARIISLDEWRELQIDKIL